MTVCKCPEAKKPIAERAWRVTDRNCHHSAFNGHRETWSAYSAVRCFACRSSWRTRAAYVKALANARPDWWKSP